MTTFSAGNLNNLRNARHKIDLYLKFFVPDTLLTARINDGSIARGQRSITFDNGSGAVGDIRQFQEVWVGSGAGKKDVGVLLLRTLTGGPTSGSFTVYEHALALENDLYLTFKRDFPLRRVPERFYNQIFYKFYDTTYSNHNLASRLLPVPRGIYDKIGILQPGSGCIIPVDFSDSYVLATGATISSYSLSVQPSSGITVNFNTSTGIGAITTSQTGSWWGILTVNDSLGNSQLCHFQIHTLSDANPGYTEFEGNWSYGSTASASLTVRGDVTLADIPDGTNFIIWCRNYFDEAESYVDVLGENKGILFYGYLQGDRSTDDLGKGTYQVSLEGIGIDGYLDKLPARSAGLRAYDNPAEWWQFDKSVLTTGRSVAHRLRWASTFMHRHEVLGLNDSTLRVAADFEEGSLFSGIDGISYGSGTLSKFRQDHLGRMHLFRDWQFLGDSDRNSSDIIFDITEDDVKNGTVDIARKHTSTNHTGQLSGFSFSSGGEGTPLVSIIPGYRESNYSYSLPAETGTSLMNQPNQLLLSQNDSNERLGRIFAYENRDLIEISMDFKASYAMAFTTIHSYGIYRLNIAGTALARELDLEQIKIICNQINYNFSGGNLGISVTFEPEAQGPDGIQGNYPTSMPLPPVTEQPQWEIQEDALSALLTAGSAWYRDDNDADWTEINLADFTYITVDPWWPIKKQNSNPLSTIWWGLCTDGIYKAEKVDANLTIIKRNSYNDPLNSWLDTPDPEESDLTYIQIVFDNWVENQGFFIAEYQNGSSEWRGWLGYTTNGGFDWFYVDLFEITAPDEIRPIWMDINGSNIYVTIWEKDGATEKLWLVEFDKSGPTYTTRYDLGTCAYSSLGSDYIAYVRTVIDDDNYISVFGRMNAPVSLSNPEHIILTENGGTSWSSVENGQGTKLIRSLKISESSGGTREYYSVLG